MVDREECLVADLGESRRKLVGSGPHLAGRQPRREQRPDDLRAEVVLLGLGDLAETLAIDLQPALDRDGPEAVRELDLDERQDAQFIFANQVARLGLRGTDCLADDQQQLDRDAGTVAELRERHIGQRREPLVRGRVGEAK